MFVAPDTAALFSRLELDDTAHPLQLVQVLVQCLEVEHFACGSLKGGRPIRVDRHNPQRGFGDETRPAIGTPDEVCWGSIEIFERRVVITVFPIRKLFQVRTNFLADAQVFDCPALHGWFEPFVDV